MNDATVQARRVDAGREEPKVAGMTPAQPPAPPTAAQLDAYRKFVGGGSRFSFVNNLAPVSYPVHS